MIQISPPITFDTILVDSSDLTVPTTATWRCPIDSVLRWVTLSWDLTNGGIINPPPNAFVYAYAGINITTTSLTSKSIPNYGVFWRTGNLIQFPVFGGATEIEPLPVHGSIQIDFKEMFFKANDTISIRTIASGTTSAVLSASIATNSAAELRQYSTSNPLLK